MDYPKLRPLEAISVKDDQICLRDPSGFSSKLLLISPDIFFICSLFDGKHSVIDIQAEYCRKFGDLLLSDKLAEIIDQLDECLFLNNQRFYETMEQAVLEFKKLPIRPAFHAGTAYEAEADALLSQLDGYFSSPDRPGPAQPGHSRQGRGRLKALIAPHIDPKRGGLCFAGGYSRLASESVAKTFVILGIAHNVTRHRYVMTDKDFETPFGTLSSDKEFIADLSERCGMDLFADEFVHRSEHSVEFQTLFLKYVYEILNRRNDIRIVPILCASFIDFINGQESPSENNEVGGFVNALRSLHRDRGDDLCFIAGVDLSHVGRRFGQEVDLTPALLKELEVDDREMMRKVLDRDAEGFFQFIRNEKDRRNVCGVPAIYTLLRLLNPGDSEFIKYDQAVDYSTQSVVTFGGAVFYE